VLVGGACRAGRRTKPRNTTASASHSDRQRTAIARNGPPSIGTNNRVNGEWALCVFDGTNSRHWRASDDGDHPMMMKTNMLACVAPNPKAATYVIALGSRTDAGPLNEPLGHDAYINQLDHRQLISDAHSSW